MIDGMPPSKRRNSLIVDIENRSEFLVEENKLKNIALFVMSELSLNKQQELSISLVDESEMAELHLKWMNESGATDVMSFRLSEISEFDFSLGDLVICPSIAFKDALKLKKSPALHLVFLLVHGILHLIGFDHQKITERITMQRLEKIIMKKITEEF